MTRIKVYDAVMGNKKTERVMDDLVHEVRPVIYITPFLSEVERVSGAIVDEFGVHVKDDDGYFMYDENHKLSNRKFMLPNNKNSDGSKLTSIKSLVDGKHNICSTHKLFSMLDLELIESIKRNKYVLVVDEALEVWSNFNLYKESDEGDDKEFSDSKGFTKTDKEMQTLISSGFIEVDPIGLLWWQDDKFKDASNTFYKEVKRLCDLKQLYLSNGRVVFWELNNTVISAFDSVTIATYMFNHSFMRHYLDIFGFEFDIEYFGLLPKDYKKHVNIVKGKMNTIGDKPFSLSFSDLTGRKDRGVDTDVLCNNLYNFMYNQRKLKPSSDLYLWTTYKKAVAKVSGGRYKKGWVAYNTKATNKFISAENVAYVCNNFPNTYMVQMVTKRSGKKFDQDMWALSEMLQFLFRSKLRKFSDESRIINLYIPSKRMRELLEWWLEQGTVEISNG